MAKTYKFETKWTTKNQVSRSFYGYPDKPTAITIHHWGNDGQRFDNVCDWLSTNNMPTSAHYVVENGRIACLASPERATFHAGSTSGNGCSVGVEMRPECTDGDIDTLIQLIYELEKTYGSMRIYVHKEWQSTACPGRYEARRNEIISRVNAMHANGGRDPGLKGADKTATPEPPKAATVTAPKRGELDAKTIADPIGGRVAPLAEILTFRFTRYQKGLDRITALESQVKALRADLDELTKDK